MTKFKTTATAAIAALGLSACASSYPGADFRPIVDTSDRAAYEADLADCQDLAFNEGGAYPGREERVGFASLAIGALIGAAIGADIGDTGAALAGAAIGATVGAASAKNALDRERKYSQADIIIRCMEGRGYNVLG